MKRRMFMFATFLFALAACTSSTGYRETVTLDATVKHSTLEGGFYYLHGDDGIDYDPRNLPTEYRQDGKRVRVKIQVRDDLASIHQFGLVVDILEISALQ